MEKLSERKKREVARVQQRYADWLKLRAELKQAGLAGDVDQAAYAVLEERLSAAESLLMTSPAPVPWVVWLKFEVLEEAIGSEDGSRHGRPEVWMVAAIKADLLSFGIGGEA